MRILLVDGVAARNVILGGLVTSTLMSLLVLPAMIWHFRHPRVRQSAPETRGS